MLRRSLLAFVIAVSAVGAVASTAQATAGPPMGHLISVTQNTFEHRLTVWGWAYDPASMYAHVDVKIYVDGHYAGHTIADGPSPNVDRDYHLSGSHAYLVTVAWTPWAHDVTARTLGVPAHQYAQTLATKAVTHYYPPPGARIISVAKRYVGVARYVEGGASPSTGFDCSGYTMYVYAQARVRTLTHSAEAQRRAMKHIAAASAQAGDLVFYLSGGVAYHVAIYAGHGMQYAAATSRDGVRYQHVWSSYVQYGTVRH